MSRVYCEPIEEPPIVESMRPVLPIVVRRPRAYVRRRRPANKAVSACVRVVFLGGMWIGGGIVGLMLGAVIACAVTGETPKALVRRMTGVELRLPLELELGAAPVDRVRPSDTSRLSPARRPAPRSGNRPGPR